MPIDRICFDAVIVVLNYDSLSKTFMVICRVLPISSNNSPGFEGDHIVANLTAYINSSVPRCPVVPAVTVAVQVVGVGPQVDVGGRVRPDAVRTRRVVGVAEVVARKSTRLNSSHVRISYAVFCLKKKKSYRSR